MSELVGSFGILEEDGKILLASEMRHLSADASPVLCHDLPGGGVEEGEALVETLVREFREETGLDVEVEDLAFMIERFGFRSSDPGRRSRFFFFRVRRVGGTLAPRDREILSAGWFPIDEARRLMTQWYHREWWTWVEGGRSARYFLTIRDPEARDAQRRERSGP